MSESINHLLWFYQNLEQQVEDIQYQRDRKQLVYFFDTVDMRGAIIGFTELYESNGNKKTFSRERFEDKKTLVRSLVAGGGFERVQMLPPHQVELRDVLQRDVPRKEAEWRKDFEQFLEDFYEYLDLPQRTDVSLGDKLAKALLEKSDLADAWFKFRQNFEPWHRRFAALHRLGILYLDDERKEWINKIVAMPEVEALKKGFEQEKWRKQLYLNNVTDSIALGYLIRMVDSFNSGATDIVPRFFDSLGKDCKPEETTFQKAIRAARLEHRFHCKNSKTSIFRDEDYFIFKVALRKPFGRGHEATDSSIIKLYDVMKRKIEEGCSPEQLSAITSDGVSLNEIITSLQKFTFLKKDWLTHEVQKEISDKLERFQETEFQSNEVFQELFFGYTNFYENQKSQKKVKDEIKHMNEQLEETLKQNLDVLSWIKDVWNPLDTAIEKLQKRFNSCESEDFNLFKDLGLLTYGFPRSCHAEINEILQNLISGDEDTICRTRAEIIERCVKAREDAAAHPGELIVTTAIFLALRLHKELFALLSKQKENLHQFSVKVGYAELLFKRFNSNLNLKKQNKPSRSDVNLTEQEFDEKQQIWQEAKEIIDDLTEEIVELAMPSLIEDAERYVAISHLCCLAWQFQVFTPPWRQAFVDANLRDACEAHRELIDTAISYAELAYDLFIEDNGGTDSPKSVHALNQFIHCTVEGGTPEQVENLRRYQHQLANFKSQNSLWQFRYDYVLAKYFHRRSIMAKDFEEKRSFLSHAKEQIRDAKKMSSGDREIEEYSTVLNAYEATIV